VRVLLAGIHALEWIGVDVLESVVGEMLESRRRIARSSVVRS
jgi:hypothetical protein